MKYINYMKMSFLNEVIRKKNKSDTLFFMLKYFRIYYFMCICDEKHYFV